MSALIASQQPGGPITAIRLLNTPQIGAVAPILLTAYATPARVAALIALGDLSVLGSQLGDGPQPVTRPALDTCVAFGRDWGDSRGLHRFTTRDGMLSAVRDDYVYLFDGTTWRGTLRVNAWWLPWKALSEMLATIRHAQQSDEVAA